MKHHKKHDRYYDRYYNYDRYYHDYSNVYQCLHIHDGDSNTSNRLNFNSHKVVRTSGNSLTAIAKCNWTSPWRLEWAVHGSGYMIKFPTYIAILSSHALTQKGRLFGITLCSDASIFHYCNRPGVIFFCQQTPLPQRPAAPYSYYHPLSVRVHPPAPLRDHTYMTSAQNPGF